MSNRLYALNLDTDGRVLSTTYDEYAPAYQPRVENLPARDVTEYRFVDGEFIHDPLPKEEVVEQPSQLDILEAQVTYTAMMTDTLLEV